MGGQVRGFDAPSHPVPDIHLTRDAISLSASSPFERKCCLASMPPPPASGMDARCTTGEKGAWLCAKKIAVAKQDEAIAHTSITNLTSVHEVFDGGRQSVVAVKSSDH
ncbi:hypothetical protein NPIL_178981 [Nephila pilipes]|uniref:Uncharacterized protein n=1 Tax=Nephila pilipes TaxID=299642 RepID=A0A8X6NC95_NEPPI|nr:hypothetical protein NPIL_178981 [Nephila pilipes]